MSELKPFPFCGGESEVVWLDSVYLHGFVARCANEDCIIVAETDMCPTEAEAIEAWNTRAERTCRDEDGWCSECAKYLMNSGYAYCPHCGAKVVER